MRMESIPNLISCLDSLIKEFAHISLFPSEIKFGIDSILDTAATPQRLKQWGVKDYRSGKHVIDESVRFAN